MYICSYVCLYGIDDISNVVLSTVFTNGFLMPPQRHFARRTARTPRSPSTLLHYVTIFYFK